MINLKNTINWKNSTENLRITILAFLAGLMAGHLLTERTHKSASKIVFEATTPVLKEAVNKETIATTNNTQIDLKTGKVKKSDSLNINIRQHPVTDQKPVNTIAKKDDCYLTKGQYNRLPRRIRRGIDKVIN